jgi:hypothetical protein
MNLSQTQSDGSELLQMASKKRTKGAIIELLQMASKK